MASPFSSVTRCSTSSGASGNRISASLRRATSHTHPPARSTVRLSTFGGNLVIPRWAWQNRAMSGRGAGVSNERVMAGPQRLAGVAGSLARLEADRPSSGSDRRTRKAAGRVGRETDLPVLPPLRATCMADDGVKARWPTSRPDQRPSRLAVPLPGLRLRRRDPPRPRIAGGSHHGAPWLGWAGAGFRRGVWGLVKLSARPFTRDQASKLGFVFPAFHRCHVARSMRAPLQNSSTVIPAARARASMASMV